MHRLVPLVYVADLALPESGNKSSLNLRYFNLYTSLSQRQWSNYGGARGGLAPLVVLKAPLVQLIFRGSGGRKTALLEPQNGPLKVAKRPP